MIQINFITANLSRYKQIELFPFLDLNEYLSKYLEPNIVKDFLATRCRDNKQSIFGGDITSSRPDEPAPLSVLLYDPVEILWVHPSF
jgi:hypothetical protein